MSYSFNVSIYFVFDYLLNIRCIKNENYTCFIIHIKMSTPPCLDNLYLHTNGLTFCYHEFSKMKECKKVVIKLF